MTDAPLLLIKPTDATRKSVATRVFQLALDARTELDSRISRKLTALQKDSQCSAAEAAT